MTAPLSARDQYASAAPFFGPAPENLSGSPEDLTRIQAYELYEDMYHNRPESFKIMLRGDDEDANPIYVPSAKKMIEATNRFLAKDYDFSVGRGAKPNQLEMERRMLNLFQREEVYSKFADQRRYGLIRGDAIWHITADDRKDPEQRISIHTLNPSNFFRISDPDNPDRMIGCHIVDVVVDPRDNTKTVARRLTYLKKGVEQTNPGYRMNPDNTQVGVTSETTHWEIGKWDDRYIEDGDLERVTNPDGDRELMDLPPQITSLPVYHWKNSRIPGEDFGLSEIAGVETLVAGINQATNDEDITLVMQGLGMYWTDAKPPLNPDGSQGNWILGPGMVAEVPAGSTFNRANGVSSVSPFQDHIGMLKGDAMEGLGIPDIAAGKVEVTVAESGISLALQMMPIIAKNEEKELEILVVMDHLLYDLVTMWFPAYEQYSDPTVSVRSIVGDPIPRNRDSAIQEIILLQTSGLITIAQAQAKLEEFGYEFMDGDDEKVLMEAHQKARAQMGELDNRYEQELEVRAHELSSNAGKSSAPQMPDTAGGVAGTIGAMTAVGA